jgi:CTP synthase (EC 6.3.4.2)
LVGKYVELPDAYISVTEALKHAGYPADSDIELDWVNANDLDDSNAAARLKGAQWDYRSWWVRGTWFRR